MSIIDLTDKPVSVYRSTDPDAPQLSATKGSLKTVLKACLVTGYGGKAALDWEMPFESDEAAAFKSKDPTATGCLLKVDHKFERAADIAGYRQMTSLDVGQDRFRQYYYRLGLMTNSARDKHKPWLLVGHSKAFIVVILDAHTGCSRCLFFGDFPSYAAADKGNCLLWHTNERRTDLEYHYATSEVLPTRSTSIDNMWRAASSADQLSYNAGIAINSRCMYGTTSYRNYPDVITGGLQADAIDLHESINGESCLRGILPGILYCSHNIKQIPDGTLINDFHDSDDDFIKFSLFYNSGSQNTHHQLFINATQWQA